MGFHITLRQLHPTVWARQTMPQSRPSCIYFPRYSPTNCLLQHPQLNSPLLTRHNFRLGNVGHQANPQEQANNYIEIPLKPLRILQSNETMVRVEYSQAPPHRMSQTVMDKRDVIHCHGQSMPDHTIHCHVKEFQ